MNCYLNDNLILFLCNILFRFSTFAVQSLSCVWLFATPCTAAHQASLSFTISQSLHKHRSIELVMPSNHLILSCPLLLPSIFPSIRVFSNDSPLNQVVKVLEFQLQHQSSNEFSELISFKTDWFDLLAVQGIHKSLLLHYSSKTSIICCSAFFMVQLWHPYMTAGKTIALTIWTFFYIIRVITICDISYLLYRTDY